MQHSDQWLYRDDKVQSVIVAIGGGCSVGKEPLGQGGQEPPPRKCGREGRVLE